jgi:hypothetical protein
LPRSNRVGKIPRRCYGSATCNGRKSRPLSKRAPPIPSAGASRRGSRFTGLAPRLLPVGHGRKPGLTPKRLATDYRRALAGDAALHLAGGGSSHPAAQTQVQAAAATTVPDQNSSPRISLTNSPAVMPTFLIRSLKTRDLCRSLGLIAKDRLGSASLMKRPPGFFDRVPMEPDWSYPASWSWIFRLPVAIPCPWNQRCAHT